MNTAAKMMMMIDRGAGAAIYAANVLALSPIGYWKLNETTGTNADNAEGTAARDGTYSGVTLNSVASPITGDNAPLFDGVSNFVDIDLANLYTAWNASEGTWAFWLKMSAAGVWTDSTVRSCLGWYDDANNYILIRRTAVDNELEFNHASTGPGQKKVLDTSLAGTTDWFHVAITWSVSNTRARAYINGSQLGADLTGLTVGMAGNPAPTSGLIGALLTSTQYWDGYISHAAIFDAELTAANITTLATAI